MLTGRLIIDSDDGLAELALATGRVAVRVLAVAVGADPEAEPLRPLLIEALTAFGAGLDATDDGSGPVVLVHVSAPREEALWAVQ